MPMVKRNHAKDMTEKSLETYGDVYADLMNVLIFGGQLVVLEGDLEQVAGFHSDFRIVADYFVQMRKTGDYRPSTQVMVHAREVLLLMSVLTEECHQKNSGGLRK